MNFFDIALKLIGPRLMVCSLVMAWPFASKSAAQVQPVTVQVQGDDNGPALAPRFLGLSYEISQLSSLNGHHYFSTNDEALVNLFRTLGIESIRVGANAVDDPDAPIPQEKDIDNFFNFARTVDAKVIYSFRLKNAAPNQAARLAAYIASRYSDSLDCFSIGNEPNFYFKTFEDYYTKWKEEYDAILTAVPQAKFNGPSVANNPPAKQNFFPLDLAQAVFSQGHLSYVSDHYYFLGRRSELEVDPAASRSRLLSDDIHQIYETAYSQIGAKLAARGIPYRIDELNNCARGGAHGSSDTYASALWALDCTHWWAAHRIVGLNYHTGEFLTGTGDYDGPHYSAFVHAENRAGFTIRPEAYAYLAFHQGAHGKPTKIQLHKEAAFDFDAYVYRDNNSIYLTLINKSFGAKAHPAAVTINLPQLPHNGGWERMDLSQKDADVAANSEISLGKMPIDSHGRWSGQWTRLAGTVSSNLLVEIAPTSASIFHFSVNSPSTTSSLSSASKP